MDARILQKTVVLFKGFVLKKIRYVVEANIVRF